MPKICLRLLGHEVEVDTPNTVDPKADEKAAELALKLLDDLLERSRDNVELLKR